MRSECDSIRGLPLLKQMINIRGKVFPFCNTAIIVVSLSRQQTMHQQHLKQKQTSGHVLQRPLTFRQGNHPDKKHFIPWPAHQKVTIQISFASDTIKI